MAKITKGYSFAFQALGYVCFDRKSHYKDVLHIFDQYLNEFVYAKIWSELSAKDKETLIAIRECKGVIKDILEMGNMKKMNYLCIEIA